MSSVWENINHKRKLRDMNNFFKVLIAGWGAKKLGGGCIGTIIVFVIIYMALGQCS